MAKYDYRRETTANIIEWIKMNGVLEEAKEQEWSYQELYDWLYDELWAHDYITGNGYDWYDTEDKCSEYLSNNFDLLYEAVREYGMDDNVNILIQHYQNKTLARYFDCTIRCYLLGECLMTALEELNNATD